MFPFPPAPWPDRQRRGVVGSPDDPISEHGYV